MWAQIVLRDDLQDADRAVMEHSMSQNLGAVPASSKSKLAAAAAAQAVPLLFGLKQAGVGGSL